MIALDLDDTVLERSAGAATLLEEVASACISSCASGTPVMIVTPFPFRPSFPPHANVAIPDGAFACLQAQ
jgi:hypothetical protein